ncbi:MAG: NAD-dependent epimerase/dehydratase family protein [Candidatus Neomarinimicrobiota bacterium]|jgi:UDP-glucose 4-epimerase|nr:GDP-mannose 4,6-dehydratase [Candidatus Neomarinimicrobiota bacterium]MDD4962175.1 GDP-mannose 4,6-dehydratase [Candidatus Neomarinimicrobiota bacterium]MDX9780375.1 GDP-mannose 4,6-dehydratase [bacterium]
MKIVITGSRGFIGSHLCSFLQKAGHDLIEADIANGCDVTKWENVRKLPPADRVIHLAAITHVVRSYQTPREMYEVNINGTLNMLEYCRIHGAGMIFNSSYVYGQPQYFPIDEAHPLAAFNPYSQSKIIGEKLCGAYHRDFALPVIVFRPFNIFGDKQTPSFLIPGILEQIRNRQTITLQNPRPKRDYVYIDDLLRAYLKAIEYGEKCGYAVLNIGSGTSYSAREVAEYMVDLSGYKLNIEYSGESRRNEVLDTVADISKIKNRLGWIPQYTLESGLRDLLRKNNLLNDL